MSIQDINEQIEILNETKSQIKQAIISKGQPVTAEDSFRSYATKIENISTINAQEKTVSPTTSQQSVTPDQNYNALSQVTVEAVTSDIDDNIQSNNIKSGVTILGVNGELEATETENLYTLTNTSLQYNLIESVPDFTKYYGKNFKAYIDNKNIIFDFTQSSGTVHTISLASIITNEIVDYTVGYYNSVEGKCYIYICSDDSIYTIVCDFAEDTAELFNKYEYDRMVENCIRYYVIANPYGNSYMVVSYGTTETENRYSIDNTAIFFGKDDNIVVSVYRTSGYTFSEGISSDRLASEKSTCFGHFTARDIIVKQGYIDGPSSASQIQNVGIRKGNIFNWFNISNIWRDTALGMNDDATFFYGYEGIGYGTSYAIEIMQVKYTFNESGTTGTVRAIYRDSVNPYGAGLGNLSYTRFRILDSNSCIILNNKWWSTYMRTINFSKHNYGENVSYIDSNDTDLTGDYYSRTDYSSTICKSDYSKIYNLCLSGTSKKVGVMLDREEVLFNVENTDYATVDNILEGKYAGGTIGVIKGGMPNNGALNYTPSKSQQTIPAGYTSGGKVLAVTSSIDSNITAGNIKNGVQILGVTGNLPIVSNIYNTTSYEVVELPVPHSPSASMIDNVIAKIGDYYCEVTGKYGNSSATYVTAYKKQNGTLTQIYDYNITGAYDWNGIIGIENDCLYIHSYNRYSSYGSNIISKHNLITGEYTRLSGLGSGGYTLKYSLFNGIFFINDNYRLYFYNMASNTLTQKTSLSSYPDGSFNGNGNPYMFVHTSNTVDNVTTIDSTIYKIWDKSHKNLGTITGAKVDCISYDNQYIFADGNVYKWNSDYSIGKLLKANVYTTASVRSISNDPFIGCVNDKYYFVNNNLCTFSDETYEFTVVEDLTGYSYFRGGSIYKVDYTNKKAYLVDFSSNSTIMGAEVDTNKYFPKEPTDLAGSEMKEYASETAMNNDLANIEEDEIVKVDDGTIITYYIKETTMKKLVKEEDTISPEEYEDNIDLVNEILGEEENS